MPKKTINENQIGLLFAPKPTISPSQIQNHLPQVEENISPKIEKPKIISQPTQSGSTKIVFYGGAETLTKSELGGVQILFDDPLAKFLFDFGQRPDHWGEYFRFPRTPRKSDFLNISDVLELYAKIPGIFRHDYEKHRKNNNIPKLPPIDALVESHSHYDHVGGVTMLRHDLPIYTHYLTKLMGYCWQYSTGRSINQFVDLIDQFSRVPNNQGNPKFVDGEEAVFPRQFNLVESGVPFKIKNMDATAYLVDHSVPGACGFIFNTSIGPIGISGDIRIRGKRPEDTRNFIENLVKAKVKYLFFEGSLLHFNHWGTEDDVTEELTKRTKTRGLSLVAFPPRDLDRLISVYETAKSCNRMLVLTSAQYQILKAHDGVNGYPKINYKNIGFLLPPKNKGLIDREDFSEELIAADYFYSEREVLELEKWGKTKEHKSKPQRVSLEDIANNQNQFILFTPMHYLQLLPEINRIKKLEDAIYTRMHPGPWTKEMEIDEDQLINFLKSFNIDYGPGKDILTPSEAKRICQIHITGHMNKTELQKEVLDHFDEKTTLVPYHTMDPRVMATMFAPRPVLIPERLKEYEL